MRLNDAGRMVHQCWDDIPYHFPYVTLDQFIVMPNHIHGIIIITHPVGAKNFSPMPKCGTSRTIGSIIRGFKIGVTKWAKGYTDMDKVWQRNYYEHIIRNDDDLRMIREYIQHNPQHWADDELHP
ncbi:MAG: transposase [Desulfuromonas sp.]